MQRRCTVCLQGGETAELLSGGKGDVVFEATPHAYHLLLHQGGASTVFAVDAEGKERPTVSVVHKFAASEGGAQHQPGRSRSLKTDKNAIFRVFCVWKVLICQIIFESNLRNPLEWSQMQKK